MVVYYALGGGLGHLTRARAFLHAYGTSEDTVLITASPFAADRRVVGELGVLRVPASLVRDPAGYRRWLIRELKRLRPRELFLDTFPAGLLGELCDVTLPGTEIHHLARRLRWELYFRQLRGCPPRLGTTYCLETLDPAHRAYLREVSKVLAPAPPLLDPPPPEDPRNNDSLARLTALKRPVWIIVHAGGSGELHELIAYARETAAVEGHSTTLVLISPTRPHSLPPEVVHLDLYPASLAFPNADRLICAAGFNSVRQTDAYRSIRRLVPMPRRYDDQFIRAAEHNEEP